MAIPERRVSLVDFKKEYREVGADIRQAIDRVCESGWYVLGEEVKSFEREFAEYIGVDHATGVASGTDAITLALKALGIKEGDGVVMPANVYPSSFGVALSGAKPQLADVDPRTLNLSVSTLERAVDKKTRAVLAVHLYGNPVDLESISRFCKANNLFLIEDCAQATGAFYKGKKVGSFGDIACFSFYPTKNLGALGDGGAVVTNNEHLAEKMRLWRMYGEEKRYQSTLLGHNSRLDEIQAAILRSKLVYVDQWNQRRREIASLYKESFTDLSLDTLDVSTESEPVYHLFVVQTEERDELANHLKAQGIATGIHYPVPIHLTPTFSNLGARGDFPVAENASKTVLSLPIYPQMTNFDVEYVIEAVRSFSKK